MNVRRVFRVTVYKMENADQLMRLSKSINYFPQKTLMMRDPPSSVAWEQKICNLVLAGGLSTNPC